MNKVALISCSSKKLQTDINIECYKLYQGNLFKKSLLHAKQINNISDIKILSAKYGLLNINDKISYYNTFIGTLSKEAYLHWNIKVMNQLEHIYDLENTIFYIYAGKKYYKNLNIKIVEIFPKSYGIGKMLKFLSDEINKKEGMF